MNSALNFHLLTGHYPPRRASPSTQPSRLSGQLGESSTPQVALAEGESEPEP
jgi:hypothetical protein